MALLLNSAATSLAPCLLPVLSQGCVGAFSRLPGWRHHQTGPAQAVAASAAVQFHATASKDSSTPAADAQLSTRNRAALPLGSKAATSKAKQQPRMLMRLQPQFTVGCQLSGNNASRLEAFHTASIQQLLPITHEKAWGQAVDAAAAFSEQAEVTSCGTWEDNPRWANVIVIRYHMQQHAAKQLNVSSPLAPCGAARCCRSLSSHGTV